jgi:DNA excision repair protein ERCC-6
MMISTSSSRESFYAASGNDASCSPFIIRKESHSFWPPFLDISSSPSSEEDALVPIEEDKPDVILEGGLRVPGGIYDRLFAYQQTGVQWLWELHCQKAGGIIGDEMGLGKTVQVVSFLGALHYSGLYKPSLVVCPVTLLRQWRREIHTW